MMLIIIVVVVGGFVILALVGLTLYFAGKKRATVSDNSPTREQVTTQNVQGGITNTPDDVECHNTQKPRDDNDTGIQMKEIDRQSPVVAVPVDASEAPTAVVV